MPNHFETSQQHQCAFGSSFDIVSIFVHAIPSSVWEKTVASSKLASGIGKKLGCNLKTSTKNLVKKPIKFRLKK